MIIFEKLDVASLMRSIFYSRKHGVYYFKSDRASKALMELMKMAGLGEAIPKSVDFHLSELREESGENSEMRIIGKDLIDVCDEIKRTALKDNPYIKALTYLMGEENADAIAMFFTKKNLLDVTTLVVYFNVIEQYVNKGILSKQARTVFFMDARPYADILGGYAKAKGIDVSFRARGMIVEIAQALPVFLFYMLAFPLKETLRWLVNGRNRGCAGTSGTGPRVGLYYNNFEDITLDFSRRNDLFWLPKSRVEPGRMLIYFRHGYVKYNSQTAARLAQAGLQSVAISNNMILPKNMPAWCHTAAYAKELVRLNAGLVKRAGIAAALADRYALYFIRDAFAFVRAYAFWTDMFSANNIKININQHDSDSMSIPMYLAVKKIGGISAGYQRSDFQIPSLFLAPCADVYFSFGPYYADIFKRIGSLIGRMVFCGYITDYAFKDVREGSLKIRRSLEEKGAKFILSYFDESASDDSISDISNKTSERIYRTLLESVINDGSLGLICKPKKPFSLKSKMPGMRVLREKAERSGRCVFLDDGLYISLSYVSEAAQASDLAIGLLFGGTAVLESHLSGVPSVYLDLESMYFFSQYAKGRDLFVFDDIGRLLARIEDLRRDRNNFKHLAAIEETVDGKDAFRDGRARERMGVYLSWLLESFDRGSSRAAAMDFAQGEYRRSYGPSYVCGEKVYG